MRDPKTALQEAAQRGRESVAYEVVGVDGPPHRRTFRSRALVGGRALGEGEGPSKQASEQAAARRALERLGAGSPPC
ncbi:MAG: putative dsRNA-binding protein [Thermoleophilia bacterium]|jgi:ribonuclease-3|nr:putative dsRNA-binding protein [Thermoleophilia bacterium]